MKFTNRQSAELDPYRTIVLSRVNTIRAPPSASDGSTCKPVTVSPAESSAAPSTADHEYGLPMALCCTDPSNVKNR